MQLGKYKLDFKKTIIMGVLNVTPDSFSDGGLYQDLDQAVKHAKHMLLEGADIIDIGGESSRPGSYEVTEEEELKRVIPVVERLIKEIEAPISIDTYKPRVAEECLKLGAHMINDISGLRHSGMAEIIAKYKASVCIMHMLGEPKTMQKDPKYSNVIEEISKYLKTQGEKAQKAGIKNIIIDPGIGFGKKLEHNIAILNNIKIFKNLNYPVLIGLSRKSFIGEITDLPVTERLEGALSATAISIYNGANIVRVHDVKETRRVAMVADALRVINTNSLYRLYDR